jgi:type IV secretion system protein TrbB
VALFTPHAVLDATICHLIDEVACGYLAKHSTQELAANFERGSGRCRLFVDDGIGPMRPLGVSLAPTAIIAVTGMLATLHGQSLDPTAPFLSCDLASGFRWHSALPPVADGPQFSIRVHPRLLRPLSDFMDAGQAERIAEAIAQRRTILIGGGTFTGKTSLVNAIINRIPLDERLVIIEDTEEIQPRAGNVVRRFATKSADLRRHVFESLRDRPDRLIIGEVRGPEALAMLDAATTGHSGLCTIHADSCDQALTRVQRLADCDERLVYEAIDVVVHIERRSDGQRAVTEIRNLKL